ncbi:MAG: GTP cyclohydrolase I FolE [Bacteroidetes bacterium]|nr:GTP cyclohydrolase I FolE [Bacteroidota bacterium]
MKQNETSLNSQENKNLSDIDGIGDAHFSANINTALREDAFELDDETKVQLIQKHFKDIMQILGLDLTDDSLVGTPKRVAKMYVKEVFKGLNPKNKPHITLFENKYKYDEMVLVKDISFHSMCEHHFLPFFGKAHVAYIPKDKVVGLSKINRLVQFFAQRPQVQERLTIQIADDIREILKTEDVAVLIEAKHLCVAARGVADSQSLTITERFRGKFNCDDRKNQFLSAIKGRE